MTLGKGAGHNVVSELYLGDLRVMPGPDLGGLTSLNARGCNGKMGRG